MNDSNHTFQASDAVRKPTGPRSRPSIHPSNPGSTMSPKKRLSTTPKSSSRNTSQRSPALSSPGSPRSEPELRRRPELYPDLSDLSFEEDEEEDEYNDASPRSSDRQSKSNTRSDYSFDLERSLNESKSRANESTRSINTPRKLPQSARNQNPNGFSITSVCLVSIVAVFAFYLFLTKKSNGEIEESVEVDESEAVKRLLTSEMQSLRNLFPSQDKGIWGEIASGIVDVKTKTHTPAIFLLLAIHNETTTCLAKRVAEVAGTALNGSGDVVLTPNMFENNISKVFELMEDRIRRSKAVVVLDLLSLEAEAMKAFHDICDQYNPLVDEAVYLYTMRSGVDEESRNLMKVAEQELRNSFSKLIKEDTLSALITRITSGAVFAIKAEKRIPCSE